MKKPIAISILVIAGVIIFYNQTKTPDWVKVNQEIVELCSYSNTECD